MFEQALSGLSTINQLELLIPTSILAVMLVAISKSGFGGGLGGLGFPLMVLVSVSYTHLTLPTNREV